MCASKGNIGEKMEEKKIKTVMEFLSSSSSDDDLYENIHVCMRKKIGKVSGFINVIREWSDIQFKKHFRISRNTTYQIINKYKVSPFGAKFKDHGGLQHISHEVEILSFIWFAANKSCLRDVSQRFGIGLSTLYRCIEKVMNFVISIAPQVIKFPKSTEEKEKLSFEFKKLSGFPGVIGCVDGTSIHISTPAHKLKHTYVNRHDTPSITLQGICDNNKKFIDVFTGAAGKVHDARVWKLSDINKEISIICENRFHIIGDNAYPLRKWLLTPYKDFGNISLQEKSYNKKICATRVIIENTFGLLKGRFRQFLKVEMHHVDKITKFIISCCVLHNMCIDNNDFIDEDDYISDCDDGAFLIENEAKLKSEGEAKRNIIKNSLQYI